MKNIGFLALAGAAMLWASGCNENPDSGAANGAGTGAPGASESAEETGEADSAGADTTDMFAAPECLIDPPPEAVCTTDVNSCGQASLCGCPGGYAYDAALGGCVLDIDGVGEATFVEVDDGACVRPASGACTRDVNACGQPSSCGCEDGFVWNSAVGKCLRDLSRPE